MLEVGKGMSPEEDRSHFFMWCMLAATLMAGNDLRKMKSQTLDILTNKEAIAIDQDELGIQAYKLGEKDSVDTWVKPLKNGVALCFLNKSIKPQSVSYKWTDNPLTDGLSGMVINFNKATYKVHDI